MVSANPLRQSGKPLFFEVADAGSLGLEAPPLRLDVATRTWARSLSAMQKEAIVLSLPTGRVWRLASDEGAYLDGDDEAPCPLSFVTTGMVSAYMHEILALATKRRITIGNIRLIQANRYTMQGSALRGTMTGGAKDVELEVQIESAADRASLTQLVLDAVAASPFEGLIRRSLPSRFALTHNGHPVACDRVATVRGPAIGTITDAAFDAARPVAGGRSDLIVRNGPSPKTAETTGFAGSSLTEHQDRTLHVRGICTLRADGVKQIEQQLFNPHGTIFHYLCDEAPDNGGHGVAPDAATYFAAGIAFCFMTQLGRYAKIARKDLSDYRVVQDAHFPTGGASGRTAQAGTVQAVETHVQLQSGEDDAFARRALDMSEQTCFLHALCRSEIRTHARLGTPD